MVQALPYQVPQMRRKLTLQVCNRILWICFHLLEYMCGVLKDLFQVYILDNGRKFSNATEELTLFRPILFEEC